MATELGFSGLMGPDASTLPEVNEDRKVRLGMFFYVCNDIILAIFFFGSYIFLRGYDTNVRWFPPGTPQPPYGQDTIIMLIAVAGAVAYIIGEFALSHDLQPVFRLMMVLSLAFFLVDLVGQVWLLHQLPFTVQSGGAFSSSYIVLSWYHVYHMAIATFLAIGVSIRAFKGFYEPRAFVVAATGHGGHVGGAAEARNPTGGAEQNTAFGQARGHTAPLGSLRNTTGIASIGYYMMWAALYAFLFWLLVIIQSPATGR
ncbi:MAG: hypothetical protein ACRDHP_10155 [Ktedonobacterales bacterium]